MAAYGSRAEMLQRYDARSLGDLVSDNGIRLTPEQLVLSDTLNSMLLDASGEIESALLQADRYLVSDLTTLLAGTSNTKYVLIRLTCDMAMRRLWDRRPWYELNESYKQRLDDAEKTLERLRKGERVFDIAEVKAAGLPDVQSPTIQNYNRLNLTVDAARRGYYPARRLQTGE